MFNEQKARDDTAFSPSKLTSATCGKEKIEFRNLSAKHKYIYRYTHETDLSIQDKHWHQNWKCCIPYPNGTILIACNVYSFDVMIFIERNLTRNPTSQRPLHVP
jgi:hypothetical protein